MSHPTVTRTRLGALFVAVTMTVTACGNSGGATSTASTAPAPSTAPSADNALANSVPQEIRDKGELVIGTNAPYAPLEFFDEDNKTLIGFDIDLGNAIGKALGLKVTWRNVAFDAIIPGLKAKRYDIGIAGFGIERDRLKVVDFVSYYVSGGGFLVKAGSGIKVNDYGNALCGLRIAVQSGTDFVADLEKVKKRCSAEGKKPPTVLGIPDQNVVVLTLTSGRADVVLADKPQVEWAASKANGKLCVTGTFRTPHSLAGIAVPKGVSGLNDALQKAVTSLIDTGEYNRITKKWGIVDGAVTESKIFTQPGEVAEGDEIFPGPVKPDCA